jgi:hypothetical protein
MAKKVDAVPEEILPEAVESEVVDTPPEMVDSTVDTSAADEGVNLSPGLQYNRMVRVPKGDFFDIEFWKDDQLIQTFNDIPNSQAAQYNGMGIEDWKVDLRVFEEALREINIESIGPMRAIETKRATQKDRDRLLELQKEAEGLKAQMENYRKTCKIVD